MVEIKSDEQLRLMRAAGLVVAEGLRAMREAATAGVTTAEVDQVGRDVLARHSATSNFLDYGAEYGNGFPGVACISVNEEVVHGIPGERVLNEGDLVSIDFGAIVDGWHGDSAISFVIGEGRPEDYELIEATHRALWAGIAAALPGNRVAQVSKAIERSIRSEPRKYGILREYTGHGIGSAMHMAPDVPNYHHMGRTPKLVPGMAIAIEPMLTLGSASTVELDDGWTVVSRDGSKGAHIEHSVAIMPDGVWVLTAPDGGQEELARLGVPCTPLAD